MRYSITAPTSIYTTIQLPASKSISNRLLILNALSKSPYPIENLSDCEDTRVIVDAFENESNIFDMKGSGTAMRFMTALLASTEGEWIIKGNERMHNRPIDPLVKVLRALGAEVTYLEKEGFPPLKLKGRKLKGGEIYLAGNISSQFASALLMVAPSMEKELIIHLENEVISKPYIHLTLGLMQEYGIKFFWEDKEIRIKPQQYIPKKMKVEGDWTSASYWYSMASLAKQAEIKLLGLQEKSLQGDCLLVNLFSELGISTEFVNDGVVLRKTDALPKKLFHNFVNEPDLAQTFVVLSCLKNIPFIFSGVQSLKIKECNRIKALQDECRKLGYELEADENGLMEWNGNKIIPSTEPIIKTYDDHRMAMAFTPACQCLDHIEIENPEVVNKSYPNFWKDIQSAGFTIKEIL